VQAGDQPARSRCSTSILMSLLETIRIMRDNGKFLSGRKLTTPPVFLGAAINPFAPPYDFRPIHRQEDRRRRAVRAEPVLLRRADVQEYMKKVADLGHRKRCSSWSASARWPRPRPRNGSGRTCPASIFRTIIKRLEGAENQKAEGKQICIDIINEVKEIKALSASMSWPTGRKNMSPRSSMSPAC
jgi:hypothetical protein